MPLMCRFARIRRSLANAQNNNTQNNYGGLWKMVTSIPPKIWFTSDLHCQHVLVSLLRGFVKPQYEWLLRSFLETVAKVGDEPDLTSETARTAYKAFQIGKYIHSKSFDLGQVADPHRHDETIKANWNSVVKPDDIVYNLGDLFVRGNWDEAMRQIKALNGRKHLVLGNHDRYYNSLPVGPVFIQAKSSYSKSTRENIERIGKYYACGTFVENANDRLFEEIYIGRQEIEIASDLRSLNSYEQGFGGSKQQVWLSHFPRVDKNAPENFPGEHQKWDTLRPLNDGKLALVGHTHQVKQYDNFLNQLNVGLDCWDLNPVSEQQILEIEI
jgi:calcineurin-like phosphoesterase family protein